jgi:Na+/glutamate symporter
MKEIAIAIIGLVVGAIIGPYVNWGIEKKKQSFARHSEAYRTPEILLTIFSVASY